jgi:hypothetical protein
LVNNGKDWRVWDGVALACALESEVEGRQGREPAEHSADEVISLVYYFRRRFISNTRRLFVLLYLGVTLSEWRDGSQRKGRRTDLKNVRGVIQVGSIQEWYSTSGGRPGGLLGARGRLGRTITGHCAGAGPRVEAL